MKANSGFSIFLVDDNSFFRTVCEQYLCNSGFANITTFGSSIDFLRMLGRQPDLIVLNHHLDLPNRIETLQKIKLFTHEYFIVFISGEKNIEMTEIALNESAFDYPIKNKVAEKIIPVLKKYYPAKVVPSKMI
jgi:DNA-binding NtrC family response regulator